MKTVGEVLRLSVDFLKMKNSFHSHSRLDVELLLAHILKIKRLDLYLNFEHPLEDTELTAIREGLKRLARHEPIQYIEGKVEFFDCTIAVDPRVLIPRPETELLVEKIVAALKRESQQGKTLVDLCSGSGCIGIAVKKDIPELTVILVDISAEAMELAKKNAQDNQVVVTCLQGDLFQPLAGQKVDFLVSNPPYISTLEYEALDQSVKTFEPQRALLAGNSGLEFYERIAGAAHFCVTSTLWLEIGSQQGAAVQALFSKAGYKTPLIEKDFAGHDRFVTIQLSSDVLQ